MAGDAEWDVQAGVGALPAARVGGGEGGVHGLAEGRGAGVGAAGCALAVPVGAVAEDEQPDRVRSGEFPPDLLAVRPAVLGWQVEGDEADGISAAPTCARSQPATSAGRGIVGSGSVVLSTPKPRKVPAWCRSSSRGPPGSAPTPIQRVTAAASSAATARPTSRTCRASGWSPETSSGTSRGGCATTATRTITVLEVTCGALSGVGASTLRCPGPGGVPRRGFVLTPAALGRCGLVASSAT